MSKQQPLAPRPVFPRRYVEPPVEVEGLPLHEQRPKVRVPVPVNYDKRFGSHAFTPIVFKQRSFSRKYPRITIWGIFIGGLGVYYSKPIYDFWINPRTEQTEEEKEIEAIWHKSSAEHLWFFAPFKNWDARQKRLAEQRRQEEEKKAQGQWKA